MLCQFLTGRSKLKKMNSISLEMKFSPLINGGGAGMNACAGINAGGWEKLKLTIGMGRLFGIGEYCGI